MGVDQIISSYNVVVMPDGVDSDKEKLAWKQSAVASRLATVCSLTSLNGENGSARTKALPSSVEFLGLTLHSVISVVWHVFTSAVLAVATVFTIGKVKDIKDRLSTHFAHIGVGVNVIAIAAQGVFKPSAACKKVDKRRSEAVKRLALPSSSSTSPNSGATPTPPAHPSPLGSPRSSPAPEPALGMSPPPSPQAPPPSLPSFGASPVPSAVPRHAASPASRSSSSSPTSPDTAIQEQVMRELQAAGVDVGKLMECGGRNDFSGMLEVLTDKRIDRAAVRAALTKSGQVSQQDMQVFLKLFEEGPDFLLSQLGEEALKRIPLMLGLVNVSESSSVRETHAYIESGAQARLTQIAVLHSASSAKKKGIGTAYRYAKNAIYSIAVMVWNVFSLALHGIAYLVTGAKNKSLKERVNIQIAAFVPTLKALLKSVEGVVKPGSVSTKLCTKLNERLSAFLDSQGDEDSPGAPPPSPPHFGGSGAGFGGAGSGFMSPVSVSTAHGARPAPPPMRREPPPLAPWLPAGSRVSPPPSDA